MTPLVSEDLEVNRAGCMAERDVTCGWRTDEQLRAKVKELEGSSSPCDDQVMFSRSFPDTGCYVMLHEIIASILQWRRYT